MRYSTPIKMALQLATKDGSLSKLLHGAINSFSHDHPDWVISDKARASLVKRLDGQIRSAFARLISDRVMLSWLEEHRDEWPELCKIRGGLRQVLADRMTEKSKNEEFTDVC